LATKAKVTEENYPNLAQKAKVTEEKYVKNWVSQSNF